MRKAKCVYSLILILLMILQMLPMPVRAAASELYYLSINGSDDLTERPFWTTEDGSAFYTALDKSLYLTGNSRSARVEVYVEGDLNIYVSGVCYLTFLEDCSLYNVTIKGLAPDSVLYVDGGFYDVRAAHNITIDGLKVICGKYPVDEYDINGHYNLVAEEGTLKIQNDAQVKLYNAAYGSELCDYGYASAVARELVVTDSTLYTTAAVSASCSYSLSTEASIFIENSTVTVDGTGEDDYRDQCLGLWSNIGDEYDEGSVLLQDITIRNSTIDAGIECYGGVFTDHKITMASNILISNSTVNGMVRNIGDTTAAGVRIDRSTIGGSGVYVESRNVPILELTGCDTVPISGGSHTSGEVTYHYKEIFDQDTGTADIHPELAGSFPGVTSVYWNLDGSVLTISPVEGADEPEMPDFTAPEEQPWADYGSLIKTVIVEEGVNYVGTHAFAGLERLTKVTLPTETEGLVIGANAFSDCSALKSIQIPADCFLNDAATLFRGCSKLTTIKVASGNPDFCSMDGVLFQSATQTDTGDLLQMLAFCPEGKSGSYTIPNGVIGVRSGAFTGCHKLTCIVVPESVTNFPVAAFYDEGLPQKLQEIRFQGDAPTFPVTYGDGSGLTVSYYEGTSGWPVVESLFPLHNVTFRELPSMIDVKPYVRKKGNSSAGTTYQMRYFTNDRSKNEAGAAVNTLAPGLFVNSVTAVSLAGADSKTADFIREQLYELLYVSKYKPVQFGGDKEILKEWPIQNTDNSGDRVSNDTGLAALGVKRVKWTNPSRGCYAYARFACAYVYGNNGSKTATLKHPGKAELIDLFHEKLDPGETIRYHVGATPHAIVFLGESLDGLGFYFLSYGGGKYRNAKDEIKEYHTMDIGYLAYRSFAENCSEVFVEDANGGSYYANKAKVVSSDTDTGYGKVGKKVSYQVLMAACPIEVVVTLEGDPLFDSRTMEDGESVENDYGILVVDSDGAEGRNAILTLYQPEIYDYDVRIFGTDGGDMDLTVKTVTEPEFEGEPVEVTTYSFRDIALTADTQVQVSDVSHQGDAVLSVSDGEYCEVWVAGKEETVTEPETDDLLQPSSVDFPDPMVKDLHISAPGTVVLELDGEEIGVDSAYVILALYRERMEACDIAAADFRQSDEIIFHLPHKPEAGLYSYQLFFLLTDGTWCPVRGNVSGQIRIEE